MSRIRRVCPKLHAEILAAGVFTQKDAADFVKLLAATARTPKCSPQSTRCAYGFRQNSPISRNARRSSILLARFVKSFHFFTCFFTYAPEIKEFATFAEYVGPQLIKQGSVSELMKQIRQTEVIKAAVALPRRGPGRRRGESPKPGKGKKGAGPPPSKVSVQDMIDEIRATFDISDEEALYIKQVTEEKAADPDHPHHCHAPTAEDRVYSGRRVSRAGQRRDSGAYNDRGRYEELSDPNTPTPAASSTSWPSPSSNTI